MFAFFLSKSKLIRIGRTIGYDLNTLGIRATEEMDITSHDTIQALEWDRICRTAASLAASPLGAERFEELQPFKTMELALKTMDRTTEMVRLQTESSGGVPMDGLSDIRDELKRVSVEGASLEPETLYRIAATMDCSSNMKDYLRHRRDNTPLLYELSDRLRGFAGCRSQDSKSNRAGRHSDG